MQFPQIRVGAHGSTYARVWKASRELKYYFYSKSKRTRYTLFQFKKASNTQQKQVTRPTKKNPEEYIRVRSWNAQKNGMWNEPRDFSRKRGRFGFFQKRLEFRE
jgi:hypothetical protein